MPRLVRTTPIDSGIIQASAVREWEEVHAVAKLEVSAIVQVVVLQRLSDD